MGKCPFNKFKDCRKDCVFYRSGIRVIEATGEKIPFEECAINIGVDCLENLVVRMCGVQKANEQVRNAFYKVLNYAQHKQLEVKDANSEVITAEVVTRSDT